MRKTIELASHRREELIDITAEVRAVVRDSGIANGVVSVYAQGATAAIMVQENWDFSASSTARAPGGPSSAP